MAAIYRCGSAKRREAILNPPSGAVLNGIDYLEVIDQVPVPGMPRQRTLLLHLFRDAPTTFGPSQVRISGGVRVRAIAVQWIERADAVSAPGVGAAEQAYYAALPDATRMLVVRTDVEGDFAPYTLALVAGAGSEEPPAGFDPALSAVELGFKVECPTDFDCAPVDACPPVSAAEPHLDYLAKDYQSFRRVLLDRLAVTLPRFRERSPADPLITVLETLAYAGDHLSYEQDAVATEAYLATARRRVSIRRHARLLDYRMHEGACARAFVALTVAAPLPLDPEITRFLALRRPNAVLAESELADLDPAPISFVPLHGALLRPAHNQIRFYTWGDEACCLPRGATRASLLSEPATPLQLSAGDVLLFEECKAAPSWKAVDADEQRRHAVRLSSVRTRVDPWNGAQVVDVEWHVEDALPFPLCLSALDGAQAIADVSVAYGNVVLAEHGEPVGPEPLEQPKANAARDQRRYRPRLKRAELSHAVRYRHELARERAALYATRTEPRAALPVIELDGLDGPWSARGDLLASSPSASDFVVELDDAGVARLRFGDGRQGRAPRVPVLPPATPADPPYEARYRVGRGTAGNVGRDTIACAVFAGMAPGSAGIVALRNPLPAVGGVDPEPTSEVKLYAPFAFRRNERAVSEADYAARAQSYPDVQRAVAIRRWTGSWYTILVVVDRKGGRALDPDFRAGLLAHLDRYRLAGFDLELAEPVFVALDVNLVVCVKPGFFRADVRRGLLDAFSASDLPDGRRGFFQPDRLSFGEPIHLSQLVATAMGVPGVEWVDLRDPRVRFQRFGLAAAGELEQQKISFGPTEIARLDNSPSLPENGRLGFDLDGGR